MIVLQDDSAEHDFPSSRLHGSLTKETCAETARNQDSYDLI